MAMPGSACAPRAQLLHTGAGVARRDAHHARRADERVGLEEVDTEAALGAEEATLTIVRVEAGSVVVEADGANYAPVVKRESKKERRARQQQDAREQQKAAATASPTTADGGGDGGTDAGVEAPTEAGVAEGEVEGAEPWLAVAGRLTNALADALADEEDEGDNWEDSFSQRVTLTRGEEGSPAVPPSPESQSRLRARANKRPLRFAPTYGRE